ncbi:TMEM175 family protein [Granulicella sp. S190]|uniref:TMEM175 family protein n=1 Tax=Granulicella sp. S190 TaxID=1747226 RepID=UPI00131C8044|nr:TMEM175 family protein [Granulicella sp. S190]
MRHTHLSTTARLEAFSDGVIAVIITIMVLELKVPHQDGIAGLYAVIPTLAIYAVSFAFTGIYWINHHHLVHRTEEADELVLYANLFFLFCLSLLPFLTSYVLEKKMDSFSVALYTSSMVFTGFSFLLLRLAIARRLRLAGKLEIQDTSVQHKHLYSLLTYLVAIPVAFYHPHLALGLCAFVTIIWITPTAGVKPREEDAPFPRP